MNAEELNTYAQCLLMKCQISGCLDMDVCEQTEESRLLLEEARAAALLLEEALTRCRERHIRPLLESYDLLHRIGFGDIPSQALMENCRDKVFHAWLDGNPDIEESDIMKILEPKNRHSRSEMTSIQTGVFDNMLSAWLDSMKIHAGFPYVSPAENYRRLALLMSMPLPESYLDEVASRQKETSKKNLETEIKRGWYRKNKLGNLSEVPADTLEAYRQFNRSLPPALQDFATMLATDTLILTALLTPYQLPTSPLFTSPLTTSPIPTSPLTTSPTSATYYRLSLSLNTHLLNSL